MPVASGTPLAELSSCLFMGTVVHEGSADAVVVATGAATQFGRIAVGLGRAASPDRVPGRPAPLLGAPGQGRRRRSASRSSSINVALGRPCHRRGAVLPRDRGRHHPAAAARGRVDQPGHRVAAAGREEGAGQAAGVHRGPRRHRRAVHRQDRHPHRRPHQLRRADRPGRRRQRRRPPARAGVQRGDPHGRHRRRRQPARRRPVGSARRGATCPTGEFRGSPSLRSTTNAGASPCSSTTTANGSSSPRALPSRSSTAAPTSPTSARRVLDASSPPATGWWPSPAAPLPS